MCVHVRVCLCLYACVFVFVCVRVYCVVALLPYALCINSQSVYVRKQHIFTVTNLMDVFCLR